MATDLTKLNLSLLPIKEETLESSVVETNFRELLEAVRLLTSAVLEIQGLFLISPELSLSLTTGRFSETFSATNSKTVSHNLGVSHPQVSLYRSDGTLIYPLVTNVDANRIRLDFSGTLTDAVVAVDVGQT